MLGLGRAADGRAHGIAAGMAVRTLWQASVGEAGDAILFPALASTASTRAQDGTVARFEASTGRESCGSMRPYPFRRSGLRRRARSGRNVRREVIALDARSGEALWRARVSSEVLSAPS